jgi:hypothetical protein
MCPHSEKNRFQHDKITMTSDAGPGLSGTLADHSLAYQADGLKGGSSRNERRFKRGKLAPLDQLAQWTDISIQGHCK